MDTVCHTPEYQNQTANSQIETRSKYRKSRDFREFCATLITPPSAGDGTVQQPVLNLDLTPVFLAMCLPLRLVVGELEGCSRRICFAELLMDNQALQRKSNPAVKQAFLLGMAFLQLTAIWGCSGVMSGQNTNPTPTPQTYSLSGTVTGGSGTTVALSGGASASTTADGSGNFNFSGLANGSYTVTPSKAGLTFSPASQSVTVNGANLTGVLFTATAQTFSVSGTVTGGSGATVTLSGAASVSTAADGSGNFNFSGLTNGNYTVAPSKAGLTFSPASQSVTVNGANVTGIAFTATAQTYSISGTIAGGSGATVALGGTANATTTANASGNYTFSGLANGNYTVTPSKAGFTIGPSSQSVTVNGANVTAVNFTAAAQTFSLSGTLTPAAGGAGSTVTLSGVASASTTSDGSGNYSFAALTNGNYALTPGHSGYSFNPTSQAVTINGANVTGVNFTATAVAPTYTISGNISPAATGAGSIATLSGGASSSTTADFSGNYSFTALANGSYTITPSSQTATFSPTSQAVTISNASVTGVNFTATGQINSAWTVLNRPGDGSNSEAENYQTANVNVSGGNLVLTEQQGTNVATGTYVGGDQPAGSFISCTAQGGSVYRCTSQYSSGAVQWTSFNVQYGDIQVRAKLNLGWPAIWLLGSNCQATNPTSPDNIGTCNWDSNGSGEIDIVEGQSISGGVTSGSGSNNVLHSNIYESGISGPNCLFPGITDPTTNYHVYELNWTSSGLTWLVDGVSVCTSNQKVTDHMFLIMNAAIGGILGGNPTGYTYPNTGYIDWVKVCSSTCSNGTTGAAAGNGMFWDDFGGPSSAALSLMPQGSGAVSSRSEDSSRPPASDSDVGALDTRSGFTKPRRVRK